LIPDWNAHAVLFLTYGMSAHPVFEGGFCLPYALTVAALVPHRDYSEAHLLYPWIGLEKIKRLACHTQPLEKAKKT